MRTSLTVLACLPLLLGGQPAGSPAISIDAAMVRLIDQVDVPARDDGVLAEIVVREGRIVKEGELLGRIDDAQPRIALQRAELDFEVATRKADNDVSIRAAVKAQEVAETELKRAVEARKSFRDAVSQAEIDALRLKAEQAVLQIEQAREEQEIARITRRIKQNEVDAAKAVLERRLVIAPWPGSIAQVHKRPGDWLQTGDKVARLVRLDRLRVEAYIRPGDLASVAVDAPVRFTIGLDKQTVEFEGTIVFVSSEVDPVNEQVRIWAEVDNPRLQLRPGQRGRLVIGGSTSRTGTN